jgi:hypothetical protein
MGAQIFSTQATLVRRQAADETNTSTASARHKIRCDSGTKVVVCSTNIFPASILWQSFIKSRIDTVRITAFTKFVILRDSTKKLSMISAMVDFERLLSV